METTIETRAAELIRDALAEDVLPEMIRALRWELRAAAIDAFDLDPPSSIVRTLAALEEAANAARM